jgi:RNA polymerase sigma factor (sigma-70 family)
MWNRRGAPLLDELFLKAYPLATRAVEVRSGTLIDLLCEAALDRDDLKQEVFAGVWAALSRFDPSRACLRTFVERVVANRITSLVRTARSHRTRRSGYELIPSMLGAAVPGDHVDLRVDIRRVIGKLSSFDRDVAVHLTEHSVVETGRRMNVSRAAVYRSVHRLKVAFAAAGLSAFRTPMLVHSRSNCITPASGVDNRGNIA